MLVDRAHTSELHTRESTSRGRSVGQHLAVGAWALILIGLVLMGGVG
jgi:hypothetical protein